MDVLMVLRLQPPNIDCFCLFLVSLLNCSSDSLASDRDGGITPMFALAAAVELNAFAVNSAGKSKTITKKQSKVVLYLLIELTVENCPYNLVMALSFVGIVSQARQTSAGQARNCFACFSFVVENPSLPSDLNEALSEALRRLGDHVSVWRSLIDLRDEYQQVQRATPESTSYEIILRHYGDNNRQPALYDGVILGSRELY
jgi:hypothetical protein